MSDNTRIISSVSRVTDINASLSSALNVSAEIANVRVDAVMERYTANVSTVPSNVYIRFGGGFYMLRGDGTSYFIRP